MPDGEVLLSSQNANYKKEIPNGYYSSEIRLELLREIINQGKLFRFRASGHSMYPYIKNQDIITVAPCSRENLHQGDIVAFIRPDTKKLTVHRIIRKKGESYLIQGDNCDKPDGFIPTSKILGTVVRIERDHQHASYGLGFERKIIAGLSKAGLLQELIKLYDLCLTGCEILLINAQGQRIFRWIAGQFRPEIIIAEADEHDMHELFIIFGLNQQDARPEPTVTTFVAKAGGRITGFVQLVRYPESHYPYTGFWLSSLMVRNRYRGMGIGKELTLKVIQTAERERSPDLTLIVNETNKPAITLYLQHNFKKVTILDPDERLGKGFEQIGGHWIPMRLTFHNNT